MKKRIEGKIQKATKESIESREKFLPPPLQKVVRVLNEINRVGKNIEKSKKLDNTCTVPVGEILEDNLVNKFVAETLDPKNQLDRKHDVVMVGEILVATAKDTLTHPCTIKKGTTLIEKTASGLKEFHRIAPRPIEKYHKYNEMFVKGHGKIEITPKDPPVTNTNNKSSKTYNNQKAKPSKMHTETLKKDSLSKKFDNYSFKPDKFEVNPFSKSSVFKNDIGRDFGFTNTKNSGNLNSFSKSSVFKNDISRDFGLTNTKNSGNDFMDSLNSFSDTNKHYEAKTFGDFSSGGNGDGFTGSGGGCDIF